MNDKVTTSPTRFNGEMDHFFDPNFTEEINQRMQVPKRIKVTGDCEDDVVMGIGGHPPPPIWENEKFDMHVPDRILVVANPDPELIESRQHSMSSSLALPRVVSNDTILSVDNHWQHTPHMELRAEKHMSRSTTGSGVGVGSPFTHPRLKSNRKRRPTMPPPDSIERYQYDSQDKLMGTRGTPIEVNHENAVLPPDPGLVRVQTPPRIITLTDHYFPSADDVPPPTVDDAPPPVVVRANRPMQPLIDMDGDRKTDMHSVRENTPSLGDGMSAHDEIAHLRRQLAKLNRRVMSIELENLQRQQCEKIVFIMGITYVVWKTLIWLRSS